MFLKEPKKSFFSKCKKLLKKPSLIFEFQTETIKLIVYNYVVVMLIANQEIGWNYPFKGVCCSVSARIYQNGIQRQGANMESAIRYGQELIEPAIQSKFGFLFRLITVIVNTLAICTVFCPTRRYRKFLLLPMLWNFYTITAIAENILEIVWTMFMLEVPFVLFSTIFLVGLFVISLQSKLTLQVLRFYEHLNYVP